eukprot:6205115-Pleurochrysis_carterae.AAC.1
MGGLAVPPKTPPPELLSAYTLRGAIPIEHFYVDDSAGGVGTHYVYPRDEVDAFVESATAKLRQAKQAKGTAGYMRSSTDSQLWLYQALAQSMSRNARALVFGSQEPWVEAVLLAMGASTVTTVEYNMLTFEHPRLRTLTVDQVKHAHAHGEEIGNYDIGVSLSSFDHDGLGRYGDPLQPDGDLRAMRMAWRMLAPGAHLILSVPVGPDVVVWNLHRRYGELRLPLILAGWGEARRFGWDEVRARAHADFRRSYEPIFALVRNGTAADMLDHTWALQRVEPAETSVQTCDA